MRTFVSFSEALETVLSRIQLIEQEEVSLPDSLGRTLASDIRSPLDLPPFASSAMDGYAVRASDLTDDGGKLKIVEHIPAGKVPERTILAGQCARIMTGAPVPDGADSVVPVEWTREQDDENLGVVLIDRGPREGVHVRPAAEDVKSGAMILRSGEVLTAGAIGMLASMGITQPTVRRRPLVGVVSTGDEVVDPSVEPGFGQIRNSNGPVLQALSGVFGGECPEYAHSPDSPELMRDILERQLEKDLLVVAGGVSVGQHDHVKSVLDEMGLKLDFWKVKQRPGKPLAFGMIGDMPVLGLPGNPVSSAMCFSVYGRRIIEAMLGRKRSGGARLSARLTENMKKVENLHYFTRGIARMNNAGLFEVSPAGAQGSNLLGSVLRANCILHLPDGKDQIEAGAEVTIELLPWTDLTPV